MSATASVICESLPPSASSKALPTRRCYLAKTAYLCIHGDHLIFMDTASGKYTGLSLPEARKVSQWIEGWPIEAGTESDPDTLQELLEEGLLTTDVSAGKDAQPLNIKLSRINLADFSSDELPIIRLKDVRLYLRCFAYAFISIRVRTLSKIVARIEHRKAQHPNRSKPINIEQLLKHMRTFSLLQVLTPVKKDTCLLYALALVEFLAPYGIFPDLIFAVRGKPFTAHALVQMGDYALTDDPTTFRDMSLLFNV